MSEPRFSALVTISHRIMGQTVAVASFVIGLVVFFVAGGGPSSWILSLAVGGGMVAIAVLVYRGLAVESVLYTARGRVFVFPKNTSPFRNWSPFIYTSYGRPDAIEYQDGAVIIRSRWEKMKVVFRDETQRESFISEVSGLVSSQSFRSTGKSS